MGDADVETREVSVGDEGLRLDRWFRRYYPDVPHAHLQKWLRTGQVRVDGHRVKPGARLSAGQRVRVPPHSEVPRIEPHSRASKPSAADLDALTQRILYEDDHVFILDKPAGLAVQGGSGTRRHLDAMLDGLRFGGERPRLVHRLDRDTAGVLALARTAQAAASLAAAFRSKQAEKLYWAIVVGVPDVEDGRIDLPLAKLPGHRGERVAADLQQGRRAVTDYRIVERAGRTAAWLALQPITGRTHQLRAHCMAIGTPILGDFKYGARAATLDGSRSGLRLHLLARSLYLPHPTDGWLAVEAPLPRHMLETWRFLGFEVPAAAPVRRTKGPEPPFSGVCRR